MHDRKVKAIRVWSQALRDIWRLLAILAAIGAIWLIVAGWGEGAI